MSSSLGRAVVRRAREEDLAPITAIYNHYVQHTVATFDLVPFRVEDRRAWFEQFDGNDSEGHPLLVAEIDGRVVGYAYYLPYRPKAAYAHTKETTIYVDPQARGRGVGSALYSELIALARRAKIHTLIGVLGGENPESAALHRKFGFELVGTCREVGFKFGAWVDTFTYQLILEGPEPEA